MDLSQGSESCRICDSRIQGQEEVEDREDQKRRNEEIKNLLSNAFEDLDNEDIISSGNTTIHTISDCEPSLPPKSLKSFEKESYGAVHKKIIEYSEIPIYLQNDFAKNFDGSIKETAINEYSGLKNQLFATADILVPNFSRNHETPLTNSRIFMNNIRNKSDLETSSNHSVRNEMSSFQSYLIDNPNLMQNSISSDIYRMESEHKHIVKSKTCLDSLYQPLNKNANKSILENTVYCHTREQLNVLNIVREREIEKLTTDIKEMQMEKEEIIKLLKRTLALTYYEIEKLNVSRNEAQNSLVSAEMQIAELRFQLSILEDANLNLEASKQNVLEELSITKNSLFEVQQKLRIEECTSPFKKNKELPEKYIQELQENYSIHLHNMQLKIESLSHQLYEKTASYKFLNKQYMDLYSRYKASKIKSANTINRLAQTLEETQRNYDKNVDTDEILNLQTQLKNVLQENYEAMKQNERLQQQLDEAKYNCNYNLISEPTTNIWKKFDRQDTIYYTIRSKMLKQEHTRIVNNRLSKESEQSKRLYRRFIDVLKICKHLEKTIVRIVTIDSIIPTYQRDEISNINKHLVEEPSRILRRIDNHISNLNFNCPENKRKNISEQQPDSSTKITELSIELQETRKQLDYVKELYVDVCKSKENGIAEYRSQFNNLKYKYQCHKLCEELQSYKQAIIMHHLSNKRLFHNQKNVLSRINLLERKLSNGKTSAEIERSIIGVNIKRDNIKEFYNYQDQFMMRNIREATIKAIKYEMELKVAVQLRKIYNHYKNKQNSDQHKFNEILLLLKQKLRQEEIEINIEKDKVSYSPSTLTDKKLKSLYGEIFSKNLLICNLLKVIRQNKEAHEEDKFLMAEVLSQWVSEIQKMKSSTINLETEIQILRTKYQKYSTEFQTFKSKTLSDLNSFKQKYILAKNEASKYKEYAKKKEEGVNNECKRIENDYKKALELIQEKIEALIRLYKEEFILQLNTIKN